MRLSPHQYIVLRLSAIGDVAMTLPLLYDAARSNPAVEIVLVSQPFMSRLLVNKPDNLLVEVFDRKKDGSLPGCIRFAKRLHHSFPAAEVVDLHDVIRTRIMRTVLRLCGHKTFSIRKPRQARRALLQRAPVPKVPPQAYVIPMHQLYRETLSRAGLDTPHGGVYLLSRHEVATRSCMIGLAPYAAHLGKCLPHEKVKELAEALLAAFPRCSLILYGAPGEEQRMNQALIDEMGSDRITVSKASKIEDELMEINTLACMISTDSANQHLAAMVETPVVGLWGATHPAAGFLGFRLDESSAVGLNLPCRPCSIYGERPCKRSDRLCLYALPVDEITRLVRRYVSKP